MLASETARYRLTDADVEEVELSVASFLIVHPRGVLMWDAGAVADRERSGPVGFEQRLVRRDGQERFVKLAPTLTSQLAGRRLRAVATSRTSRCRTTTGTTRPTRTCSRGAQWLVPKLEHDAMFSRGSAGRHAARDVLGAQERRTTLLTAAEHDVFGDGTVVIRQATATPKATRCCT